LILDKSVLYFYLLQQIIKTLKSKEWNSFLWKKENLLSLWLSNGINSNVMAKPFLKSSVWRQVAKRKQY